MLCESCCVFLVLVFESVFDVRAFILCYRIVLLVLVIVCSYCVVLSNLFVKQHHVVL